MERERDREKERERRIEREKRDGIIIDCRTDWV
jgi:hypothetical protein